MSIFTAMGAFARKTKVVRMASPEDVLSEEKVWSIDQLSVPILHRGEPQAVKLEIRPGAETMDFTIRPLTMSEREAADKILDSAIPPQTYVEELPVRPGDVGKRIPSGYDYEAPSYLADMRPLHERQAAYVILKGVEGMEECTPGADTNQKMAAIMDTMPSRIVKFLASEIWSMTYAQGNPADFFTKEDSSNSPSSEPSPSRSQGDKKKKS